MVKEYWWKILGVLLIIYSFVIGLTGPIPQDPKSTYNIYESIRNLYYHVPMWFTMMTAFTIGFVYTILYLTKFNIKYDIRARTFNEIGMLFGMMGIVTGMLWARFTWGDFWNNDSKQVGAALCLSSYAAYFVLRGSIKDEQSRAKISGVYSIFAYALMIPFIYIIPDLSKDSLHPGGGNMVSFSDFSSLDGDMRMVLYPASLGWIIISIWIAQIKSNYSEIKNTLNNI